ncbi:Fic family protein [Hansschlegelia quercus]|uniref:Cell filamentation protein Fic n=1 Tax=Hansschlegelia quercus TaxID=2528245 RepID=A0A4Q9GH97_9HYPH|nr:Fic family protein [Hansschlegelia quercus]TBN53348.1 cell filamentation protein Fic [Hansschlegelia quercus]
MTDPLNGEAARHSRALEPELISDPIKKAEAEARNGLRQYDAGERVIQEAIERGEFRLRPSLILGLQREALAGISSYAGNYRPAGVAIEGSKHEPPGAHFVAELVEDLCDYVNQNWETKTAIHLAAYIMWRLNWIHPFADGNGRTSRTTAYIVLSVKLRALLPGSPTIPDQIVDNRTPYFDALDSADLAFLGGATNVEDMEKLLGVLLAVQLRNAYEQAGGDMTTETRGDE